MAVVYRHGADGGFTAGNTETGHAAHAPSKSIRAQEAHEHPERVAAEMMDIEDRRDRTPDMEDARLFEEVLIPGAHDRSTKTVPQAELDNVTMRPPQVEPKHARESVGADALREKLKRPEMKPTQAMPGLGSLAQGKIQTPSAPRYGDPNFGSEAVAKMKQANQQQAQQQRPKQER